jgi:SAM-dependent methyltransferase
LSPIIYVLLSVLAVMIILPLAWRFASRGHSLPCPAWLRWLVELDSPFVRSNRASVIVEHLALRPGMRVLDVGCGPGRLTVPIAEKVGSQGEVVAIDIQPRMLARAREKARQAGLNNVSFHEVKMGHSQLDFGQFDRAVLVTVLGEIPEREAALAEIFRVLKPGGLLSVTEIILDPHFQGREAVLRLAGAAGFREKAFLGGRFAFSMHLQKPV